MITDEWIKEELLRQQFSEDECKQFNEQIAKCKAQLYQTISGIVQNETLTFSVVNFLKSHEIVIAEGSDNFPLKFIFTLLQKNKSVCLLSMNIYMEANNLQWLIRLLEVNKNIYSLNVGSIGLSSIGIVSPLQMIEILKNSNVRRIAFGQTKLNANGTYVGVHLDWLAVIMGLLQSNPLLESVDFECFPHAHSHKALCEIFSLNHPALSKVSVMFEDSYIKHSDLKNFLDVLSRNNVITSFAIEADKKTSPVVLSCFEALVANKKVTSLDFRMSKIFSSKQGLKIKKLVNFLNHSTTLTSLKLRHHGLSLKDMESLREVLANNQTLEVLDLSRNDLVSRKKFVASVCAILQQNTYLREVNIEDNNFSTEALQAIFAALETNRRSRITVLKLDNATNLKSDPSDKILAEISTLILQRSEQMARCAREVFLMGAHKRLGKDSSIGHLIKNSLQSSDVTRLLFKFAGLAVTKKQPSAALSGKESKEAMDTESSAGLGLLSGHSRAGSAASSTLQGASSAGAGSGSGSGSSSRSSLGSSASASTSASQTASDASALSTFAFASSSAGSAGSGGSSFYASQAEDDELSPFNLARYTSSAMALLSSSGSGFGAGAGAGSASAMMSADSFTAFSSNGFMVSAGAAGAPSNDFDDDFLEDEVMPQVEATGAGVLSEQGTKRALAGDKEMSKAKRAKLT